jgi:hypothetical protein
MDYSHLCFGFVHASGVRPTAQSLETDLTRPMHEKKHKRLSRLSTSHPDVDTSKDTEAIQAMPKLLVCAKHLWPMNSPHCLDSSNHRLTPYHIEFYNDYGQMYIVHTNFHQQRSDRLYFLSWKFQPYSKCSIPNALAFFSCSDTERVSPLPNTFLLYSNVQCTCGRPASRLPICKP